MESPCPQRLGGAVAGLLAALLLPLAAGAQALHVEQLSGGTEVVLVSLPLSEATTIAWPQRDGGVAAVTSGDLTLVADLETRLGTLETAPRVVVAVGGVRADDLRGALERFVAGRALGATAGEVRSDLVEGGVERRLGGAGDEATIRLELPLPSPGDWQRSTVEVLLEMLPSMLGERIPGLSSQMAGNVGVLSRTVDAQLAGVALRDLRLQLARLAADPELGGEQVEMARQRVEVRRLAALGNHPEGAKDLVRLWLDGGDAAIRERLFGAAGVTETGLREAAARWFPTHPGRGVLVLPPRVFNPRFAPGAQTVQLDNDAMAAVLERPGAGLAAVVLRPVLVQDLDGGLTTLVLARLAAEVRASGMAPGWVRVGQDPPLLELAAPPDGLAEILEAVQPALERVSGDDRPVVVDGADARRRALQLMATVLGLGEEGGPVPARLLQPSNLALGIVAPDGEAALEAVRKFGVGGGAPTMAPHGGEVEPTSRTREAVAGDTSVLVVELELARGTGEVIPVALKELLRARARSLEEEVQMEVLQPLVPGRRVLLLVARAELPLADLEQRVRAAWPGLTARASTAELDDLRRRLAAELAVAGSGPLGAARRCAAVAAGAATWRGAADLEMEALRLDPEPMNQALAGLAPWSERVTTGAGVLPIPAVRTPGP
jgi:hypothetical protein